MIRLLVGGFVGQLVNNWIAGIESAGASAPPGSFRKAKEKKRCSFYQA